MSRLSYNHHPQKVMHRFVCEHNSEGDGDRYWVEPANHKHPKGEFMR